MKSAKWAMSTSVIAVQHISAHGFGLFVEPTARECFLPFSESPSFRQATIDDILTVEIHDEPRDGIATDFGEHRDDAPPITAGWQGACAVLAEPGGFR